MSGIYLHIPFCKTKCFYCDFYKTTKIDLQNEYTEALLKEIELKKNYLKSKQIETLYFGGGTPTLLSDSNLFKIFEKLYKVFNFSEDCEITYEANPDDIDLKKLKVLKLQNINRLSIGIQSFFDDDLQLMNRRHNAKEAEKSIKLSQDFGFHNISGDFIYGLPKTDSKKVKQNLQKYIQLNIQHISAYHITYEKDTVFYDLLKNNKINPLNEEQSVENFEILNEYLKQNEFIRYEISNFSKPGYFSKHNSSYWLQKEYIGLGASAHSYNFVSRSYNFSDVNLYIKNINNGEKYFEKEILTNSELYNEFVITRLRTAFGVNEKMLLKNFGEKFYNYFKSVSKKHLSNKSLVRVGEKLILSEDVVFISDNIIKDFIFVD